MVYLMCHRCNDALRKLELRRKDVGLEGVLLPISLHTATYSNRLEIQFWFGFHAQRINSLQGVKCYRFPPPCFTGSLNGMPCF